MAFVGIDLVAADVDAGDVRDDDDVYLITIGPPEHFFAMFDRVWILLGDISIPNGYTNVLPLCKCLVDEILMAVMKRLPSTDKHSVLLVPIEHIAMILLCQHIYGIVGNQHLLRPCSTLVASSAGQSVRCSRVFMFVTRGARVRRVLLPERAVLQ